MPKNKKGALQTMRKKRLSIKKMTNIIQTARSTIPHNPAIKPGQHKPVIITPVLTEVDEPQKIKKKKKRRKAMKSLCGLFVRKTLRKR